MGEKEEPVLKRVLELQRDAIIAEIRSPQQNQGAQP